MAEERPWKVHTHQPLVKHESNLWTVEGSLPRSEIRRRMTLVRLADGSVCVISPVPLDDGSMRDIEAWGPVRILIPPNPFHDMDIGPYARRYPEAKVFCVPQIHKKIRARARVDGTLSDLPANSGLRVETLEGTRADEPCFVVEHADGTRSLIFTDAVFNQPHVGGAVGTIFRWIGSTGGPRVTKVFKMAAIKDRAAFRASMQHVFAIPGVNRIVMAHGHIAEGAASVQDFARLVDASLA